MRSSKFHGVIQAIFSFYLIYSNGERFYYQNTGGILYLFMFPKWTLYMNMVLGIVSLGISVAVFLNKIKAKINYVFLLVIIILDLLLTIF